MLYHPTRTRRLGALLTACVLSFVAAVCPVMADEQPPNPESNPGANTDAVVTFTDVPSGHWAAEAISHVVRLGLFGGTSANTFSPNDNITQAMMVTVLARYAGRNTTSADGEWYSAAMKWALDNKIVAEADPYAILTRDEFAVIMYNYATFQGNQTTSQTADLSRFADAGQIKESAKQAMQWAVATGLLAGTSSSTLSPKSQLTRAQVAAVITRFDKNAENSDLVVPPEVADGPTEAPPESSGEQPETPEDEVDFDALPSAPTD